MAFGPLGWKAVAFSEIEPFPCAVLKHHYPDVPNFGDMTKFKDWPEEVFASADAVVGGPPCQAFSVAGLRKGLTDARGNLTLVYVELINHADLIRKKYGKPPVIALYENVPGLLSDKTGAYGCLLGALAGEDGEVVAPGGKWTDAGCVFGPERTIAWRLFDAQYHAVAQRRRRVFVVASARNGFDPAAVLFEFEGVRRDTAPSREARQGVTGGVEIGPGGGRLTDLNPTLDTRAKDGPIRNQLAGAVLAFGGNNTAWAIDQAAALNANRGCHNPGDFEAGTLLVVGTLQANGKAAGSATQQDAESGLLVPMVAHPPAIAFPSNLSGPQCASSEELSPALGALNPTAVAFTVGNLVRGAGPSPSNEVFPTLTMSKGSGLSDQQSSVAVAIRTAQTGSNGWGINTEGTAYTLDSAQQAVQTAMQVRRLTPVECERLQGFPDNYSRIPWRKKPAEDCPDGPRYKALGNSWAVPNVRWIGQRIVDHLAKRPT